MHGYLKHTPLSETLQLLKDDIESKHVDISVYQSMVVGYYEQPSAHDRILPKPSAQPMSSFNEVPKEAHLTAVRCVLRYLKRTANLGIVYGPISEPGLVGLADAKVGWRL